MIDPKWVYNYPILHSHYITILIPYWYHIDTILIPYWYHIDTILIPQMWFQAQNLAPLRRLVAPWTRPEASSSPDSRRHLGELRRLGPGIPWTMKINHGMWYMGKHRKNCGESMVCFPRKLVYRWLIFHIFLHVYPFTLSIYLSIYICISPKLASLNKINHRIFG